MNLRRIFAILSKDLRDAVRDGRIVVLLALPIGMAVLYNATIEDQDTLPTTDIAVVESSGGAVARELRAATGKSAELRVRSASSPESARKLVADDEDVELAVVVREGETAGPPSALVLVAQNASPAAQSVAALVPDALARAVGRTPAARTQVRSVAPASQLPYELFEPRALTVLMMIVLLATFVAMMVVPMQTAEEFESGTFSALRLAATGPEVLSAKALAGFIYGLLGVALTVAFTSLEVHAPLLFFGASLALTASLVGFGLLMGLLIRNANAINTYAAFLLIPLVGLAGAVFFVDSGALSVVLDILPFSQAAKLLADGLSADSPFQAGLGAWAVIAAWALLGYGSLARIASRREI